MSRGSQAVFVMFFLTLHSNDKFITKKALSEVGTRDRSQSRNQNVMFIKSACELNLLNIILINILNHYD